MRTSGKGRRRGSWGVRYREARAHATIAALILWTGAAIVTFAARGDRNLVDHLKSEDFVQIYTLAHSAFEGPYPTLDTQDAFYQRQVELVPASKGDRYLPVYPPTAAVIFRPMTALSYMGAALLWALVTSAGYAWATWGAWRPYRTILPDRGLPVAAALAFPPFYLLILHGQTTVLPLLAFFIAWRALKSDRPVAAGLALGLLSVKPQFGLVVGLVLIAGLNWRVLIGLFVSSTIQIAGVIWTMGMQAFEAYFRTMTALRAVEHLVEPDAWRMHSLRTLTRLVPGIAGDLVWAAAAVLVVSIAIRVWRSAAPLDARFGVIVLATVLVNPHLFAYDAVVLVLPFIWLGGWLESTGASIRRSYWQAVYAASVLLLLPTAGVMYVQGSVLVLLWMLWRTSQEALSSSRGQASLTNEQHQDIRIVVGPDAS